MIRRTTKIAIRSLAVAAMIAGASAGHAGTTAVSPALAACSKALVESLARSETLPTYTVKAPSSFASTLVDPNSFTVLAHNRKSKELLAKASCKATPAGEIVSFKTIPVKS